MRALVFEQWQGGHYFNYLECLVPRLASICDEVVVAVTALAAGSPRFAEQLGHLEALPNVRFDRGVPIPDGRSRLRFRAQLGRNVVDAIDRHRPHCVFLPSADEQVLALPLHALAGRAGRARRVHLEAVLHYKGYTARDSGSERLLSALQGQLLKTGVFDCLNFVNFLQHEDAVERRLPWAAMSRAAGDPVPQPPRIGRTAARHALGLDPGGRYIGMIGDLDARKAVPATLAAFRAAGLSADDRLLLAGRHAEAYAQVLRDDYQDLVRAGRVVVMDRFLSAAELQAAFCALDLHVSVYHRFAGLSSLMLKGLAAGVPVVANDHGWARAVVRRFEVGRTVEPSDTTAFASVLAGGLDESAAYRESPATTRLLAFHSIDNFTAGLVERVAAAAGRPLQAPILPWSWVMEAVPSERRALR
jgi:glycosyltransferase involved in cell wall biosynthesis